MALRASGTIKPPFSPLLRFEIRYLDSLSLSLSLSPLESIRGYSRPVTRTKRLAFLTADALTAQDLAGGGVAALETIRRSSSGSGNTTVVFFSTPISVSVCR